MKLREILEKRWGTFTELLIFFLIALSTIQPGIIIPLLVAIFIISMKTRRIRWAWIGFDLPKAKLSHILLGILLAGIYFLLFNFIIDPIVDTWLPPANLAAFEGVRNHLEQLLIWLVITWSVAAVFEELIFRGYLINRLIDLLGESFPMKFIIVILAGAVFGFVHFYQGWHGVITAGMIGVLQSVVFLLNKRKLLIPMVIHGTFDTIGFMMLYIS